MIHVQSEQLCKTSMFIPMFLWYMFKLQTSILMIPGSLSEWKGTTTPTFSTLEVILTLWGLVILIGEEVRPTVGRPREHAQRWAVEMERPKIVLTMVNYCPAMHPKIVIDPSWKCSNIAHVHFWGSEDGLLFRLYTTACVGERWWQPQDHVSCRTKCHTKTCTISQGV